MAAHRAAAHPDPLSAHLPAIILAAMALAVCVILLGVRLEQQAGLIPTEPGAVPTVTQTPDDPAAAQPWTMPRR